jgi:hypothetical protein
MTGRLYYRTGPPAETHARTGDESQAKTIYAVRERVGFGDD